MILSAQTIRSLCVGPLIEISELNPLITPFHERTVFRGLSFGLSGHGYDIRIAEDIHLAPRQFALASSVERFDMHPGLAAIVHDKSSWARQGLSVFNTVIEAGWCGFLTLELINHGPEPIVINRGSAIAQIVFHRLDIPTQQVYSGKYQNQEAGPQPARLEG